MVIQHKSGNFERGGSEREARVFLLISFLRIVKLQGKDFITLLEFML